MEPLQNKYRVPELDGIRGIAILSVICYHYLSMQGVTTPGSITDRLQRLVILGGTGVDLFFVLSGFLIGGILLDAKESRHYFKTFYIRRFFRIFPVYYAWITAYVVVAAFGAKRLAALSNSGSAPPLNFDVYRHYLFLQNFVEGRFHNLAGSWFDHLWSLAVEEQFYLVIPLVVWLLSRKALKYFLIVIVIVLPLLRIVLTQTGMLSPGLIGQLMFTRMDVLAFGVLAALCWREESVRTWLQNNARWIYGALFVLFLGCSVFWKWSPYYNTFPMQAAGFSTFAAFYTVLLFAALSVPRGPVAVATRWGWLRQVGGVSYCMYLIHLVVLVACHAILLHASPKTSNLRGALVTLLAVVLTFVVAKISWVIFERPLLQIGHKFRY